MLYTKLTKVIKDSSGQEQVACIDFGTSRCRIHNGIQSCAHCPMMSAMLNQLHAFEQLIDEESEGQDEAQ